SRVPAYTRAAFRPRRQAFGGGSSGASNGSIYGPRASQRWNGRRISGATLRGAKRINDPIQLDILKILDLLPHRYPFLLVDRVLECRSGESIRALKNVTYNEPFFPGHFPVRPVMPGVMIIEALAQTAGILAFVTAGIIPNDTTR